MKKRGAITLTLVYALEFVAGVIVALLIIHLATSIGKGEAISKDYLARDLALQLNTLYAVPGNAYIVNSEKMDKFSIRFNNEFVEVYQFEKDPTKGMYPYVRTENSKLELIFNKPNQLVLVKDGDKIKVQETIPEFTKTKCPQIDTKDLNWQDNKIIIIDPGHGYEPNKEVNEADTTTNIVSSLTVHLKESNYKLTRKGTYEPLNERLNIIENEKADIVISIHTGSHSDKDKNTIYAYIPKNNKERESWKLACLILNQLTEKFEIDETKIHRINIEELKYNDPKQILKSPDKVSVMLDVSNIQNEKGETMLKQIVDIAKAISDGIEEYYTK